MIRKLVVVPNLGRLPLLGESGGEIRHQKKEVELKGWNNLLKSKLRENCYC